MLLGLRLLLTIIIIQFGFRAFCQLEVIREFKGRLGSFTMEDGLSHKSVYSINQDAAGFIWIGTGIGLNKYDGIKFENFYSDINDSTSLGNNYVRDLYFEEDGMFWVSTWGGGINVFDRENYNFISSTDILWSDSINIHNHVEFVVREPAGALWTGTLNGLVYLDPESKTFITYQNIPGDPHSISDNWVIENIIAQNQAPVFLTSDGKLNFFNPESGFSEKLIITSPAVGKDYVKITTLFQLDKDKILLGTESGLFEYSYSSKKYREINIISSDNNSVPSYHITEIFKYSDGILWLGTINNGILEVQYNGNELPRTLYCSQDDQLSDTKINVIFQDRQQNIWIGTEDDGLKVIYNINKKFHFIDIPPSSIQAIEPGNDNSLWIGSFTGGLYKYNLQSRKYRVYTEEDGLSSNNIRSLFLSGDDSLLIGTNNGLNSMDLSTGKISNTAKLHDCLASPIVCITQDKEGNFWLGSDNKGLILIDAKTKEVSYFTASSENPLIGNYNIRSILFDNEDNLWVGIYGGGLNRFDPKIKSFTKRYLHQTGQNSINDNNVGDMIVDVNGEIWIATYNGGINIFNPRDESFRSITQKDGLPSNTIASIIEDSNRNKWISTAKGIININRDFSEIRQFSNSDGLLSNLFNHKAKNHEPGEYIFFGSHRGVNYFKPEEIKENEEIPNLVFTDFKINNISLLDFNDNPPLKKHISLSDSILLKYDQTNISIEFVALNLISSAKNNYAYRLDGLEKDWIYTGNQSRANYSSIPPGEYRFLVKASNNDQHWTPEPESLYIRVFPPPWKSPLAYTFYIILFISLNIFVIWLIRWIFRRRHDLQVIQIERDAERQLTQFKLQFFTNISHEVRTHLTLMSSPIRKLLKKKQSRDNLKYLELIQLNVNRLTNLTNEIMEFRRIEQGKIKLIQITHDIVEYTQSIKNQYNSVAEEYGILYEFDSEPEKLEWSFDPEKLRKILHNLISNAFKYTPDGGMIKVYLKTKNVNDNYTLRIGVKDSGIGIPDAHLPHIFDRFFNPGEMEKIHSGLESSGIGLALVKQLVELHGGKISVISEPGKGSDFFFDLENKIADIDESEAEQKEIFEQDNFETWDNISKLEREKIHSPKPATIRKIDPALPNLLLIDDNPEIIQSLKDSIGTNYNLYSALNGNKALKLIHDQDIDIIISDVMMPEMDGIQLCNVLKSDIKTSHIPVILLTAKSGIENELEGLKSGADGYIVKPFHIDKLILTIDNILKSRANLHKFFLGKDSEDETKEQINPIDKKLLGKIDTLIKSRLTDSELNVETISKEIGLSRMHLYRKLKAITGLNPTDYINYLKLSKSKELLKQADLSISDIAYESGFSSPANFATAFKKYYGKSPARFRTEDLK